MQEFWWKLLQVYIFHCSSLDTLLKAVPLLTIVNIQQNGVRKMYRVTPYCSLCVLLPETLFVQEQVRSHMREAVAGRKRAIFDIPASHIRGWLVECLGRICHVCGAEVWVWGARFRSGHGKFGIGPISCGFYSRSVSTPRTRMCEHMPWFV